MLNTRNPGDIRAKGSWYHDEVTLPYYLHIDFFNPGYDKNSWTNAGFSFLFNLRTGKLMQMEYTVVVEKNERTQSIPVDLLARCDAGTVKSLLQTR